MKISCLHDAVRQGAISGKKTGIGVICWLAVKRFVDKTSSQPPPEWLSRAGFSKGEGQGLLKIRENTWQKQFVVIRVIRGKKIRGKKVLNNKKIKYEK